MARALSEEVTDLIKKLVTQLSGFEEGTDIFNHAEKYFKTELRKADSLYFLNKRDVDKDIVSMSEKYMFHGFFGQAEALKVAYNKYVTSDLTKDELLIRLNIVKFLLGTSENPTGKFLLHPEEYTVTPTKEEEKINWKEYLNEGIEKWEPNFDESTDCTDSSSSSDDDFDSKQAAAEEIATNSERVFIENPDTEEVLDLRANREELLATIQHTWYNQSRVHCLPASKWQTANFGILWERYLEKQVNGLVPYQSASIISEYKVIREIFWQLWEPHSSVVFEMRGDKLVPKSHITIASVRTVAFEAFLLEFIPYIEVLDFFREFSQSLLNNINSVPLTFRSYECSINKIIKPVYESLSQLEEEVRLQDETYTVLKLAHKLRSMFKPLVVLKKIHDEVVIDFQNKTPLESSISLITLLHNSLQESTDKLEQDLKLTLFLDCLYHYFTLIDSWLMKGDLLDPRGEFLINDTRSVPLNYSQPESERTNIQLSEEYTWHMNFQLKTNINEFCLNNSMIKIITSQVLQIGTNIHLLKLLGKFNLSTDYPETIYAEFVRKSLQEMCKFYDKKPTKKQPPDLVNTSTSCSSLKHPVVCPDACKKPTDMDKLENLVDTTDGLLMTAFGDYFIEIFHESSKSKEDETIYEKISSITKSLFPVECFFENIFTSVLTERFTISGLMVKNLLIEQYKLDKQFEFLRHVFLFFDDLIFPFYRRFFEKSNTSNKYWGNEVWLTTHLQDIIMDVYPDFYENSLVEVKENWRSCAYSLEACSFINIGYNILWPLNIIITTQQMSLYRNIFQYILRIKWGLYTLNHLSFTDIEARKTQSENNQLIMQILCLRFNLINILNSIQHYIFGFVFNKFLMKFELDFEKSNDLKSIMLAHAEFICAMHRMVSDVCEDSNVEFGFKAVLHCVKMLEIMWTDEKRVISPAKLSECYKIYKAAYDVINPIINPVYIFDY